MAPDGVIEERIQYVLDSGADGEPGKYEDMSRFDRGQIEVHYLPARRDPADQVSYTTKSLIARGLRAVDWTEERRGRLPHRVDEVVACMRAVISRARCARPPAHR